MSKHGAQWVSRERGMTPKDTMNYCPHCGNDVAVRKDGRLRKHLRWFSGRGYGSVPRWDTCEGTGQIGVERDRR